METESRPRWLLIALALLTGLLVYRFSGFMISALVAVARHAPGWLSEFAQAWQDFLLLIIPVSCAVLAARWQEGKLRRKSRRTNIHYLVIIGLLALCPLRIQIGPPQPVSFAEKQLALMPVFSIDVQYRPIVSEGLAAEQMQLERTSKTVWVAKEPVLEMRHYAHARHAAGPSSEAYQVELELTDIGTRKISTYAAENIGAQIGIVIDGHLIRAPTIHTPLASSPVMIPVDMSEVEAAHMARRINFMIRQREEWKD